MTNITIHAVGMTTVELSAVAAVVVAADSVVVVAVVDAVAVIASFASLASPLAVGDVLAKNSPIAAFTSSACSIMKSDGHLSLSPIPFVVWLLDISSRVLLVYPNRPLRLDRPKSQAHESPCARLIVHTQ